MPIHIVHSSADVTTIDRFSSYLPPDTQPNKKEWLLLLGDSNNNKHEGKVALTLCEYHEVTN